MSIFDNKLEQLGEILKKTRIEKGYSTRKLAELSKVASNAEVSMLENAKRLKPDPIMLKAIAKNLGLDYIKLFQLIGYLDEEIPETLKASSIPLDQEIKVYSSISIEKKVPIFSEYVKTLYLPYCGEDCIGFIATGDSMEPRIPDNSIVIIDQKIKLLDNRSVGMFLINGEPCIKRIIKQNDIEYLISDNQNYDPIFINQNQDIVVIGKITKLIVENFN